VALYGEGRIRPAVTARFSLAQGAEAIARLEAREARGKMVITMAGKP
jgi:NADPH:quinone reductase